MTRNLKKVVHNRTFDADQEDHRAKPEDDRASVGEEGEITPPKTITGLFIQYSYIT